MTRRERLEARLERGVEWAQKAARRSDTAFSAIHRLADLIPLGQPILLGHHSERHARRDAERITNGMTRGCEEAKLAGHHRACADWLELALDRSIFSDDADAIARIEEKIAGLEARRARYRTVNAAWRKAGKPKADDTDGWGKVATILGCQPEDLREGRLNQARDFIDRGPYPSYLGQNAGGEIGRLKARIEEIRRRSERAEAAEAAGGMTIEGEDYVSVTFAEKPERSTIDALKAAGFHWSGGSWHGYRASLPSGIIP